MTAQGRLLPIAVAVLLLPGCASSRRAELDQAAADAALAPAGWASPADSDAVSESWIAAFGDAELEALVAEALAANFGLESSAQRARAAAAAARIAGAARIPALGAGLRSSRQKSFIATPGFSGPIESESHALNLSAQWEIDVWNRLGQARDAAIDLREASVHDVQALRLSLTSQVAKTWFNAIEARFQYELATASAASFDAKLDTLESRYRRGLAEAFDLRLLRAQAASSRAAALSRRVQLDSAVRLLETLLGRYPAAALAVGDRLPATPPPPSAGLPATLLERRPDLLAQGRRLAAAAAHESSARRNWLPAISLTASDGTAATRFADLLDDAFNVWSVAGAVAQPIFQGGRLKAERTQADANYLSALAQYKETALRAFREVETALRAESELAELERQAVIAAGESERAEEQAWRLYGRGLVDISAALDAQRRAFDARSQRISVENRRLQNRVDLHIALGGALSEPAHPTATPSRHE